MDAYVFVYFRYFFNFFYGPPHLKYWYLLCHHCLLDAILGLTLGIITFIIVIYVHGLFCHHTDCCWPSSSSCYRTIVIAECPRHHRHRSGPGWLWLLLSSSRVPPSSWCLGTRWLDWTIIIITITIPSTYCTLHHRSWRLLADTGSDQVWLLYFNSRAIFKDSSLKFCCWTFTHSHFSN